MSSSGKDEVSFVKSALPSARVRKPTLKAQEAEEENRRRREEADKRTGELLRKREEQAKKDAEHQQERVLELMGSLSLLQPSPQPLIVPRDWPKHIPLISMDFEVR